MFRFQFFFFFFLLRNHSHSSRLHTRTHTPPPLAYLNLHQAIGVNVSTDGRAIDGSDDGRWWRRPLVGASGAINDAEEESDQELRRPQTDCRKQRRLNIVDFRLNRINPFVRKETRIGRKASRSRGPSVPAGVGVNKNVAVLPGAPKGGWVSG